MFGIPRLIRIGLIGSLVVVIVEHGNVTLTGVVNSNDERQKAEAIARGTFSVMSVTNKLRIQREE